MLCGKNGIGIDESFNDVEKLDSFSSSRSASCTDASCSRVAAWVEDKALIRESASAAWFTLPFTCPGLW